MKNERILIIDNLLGSRLPESQFLANKLVIRMAGHEQHKTNF